MAAKRWEFSGVMACSSSSFSVRMKAALQLGEKVKRSSQECHMAADRFTAGQAADGLVDNRLENGGGKVFFGRALVDQGLDIGLCENAAAGGNGIKGFVIFCVFIQAGGIRLKQGSHLVDKGTGTAGTDAVHTLLHISAFKIDDLRVLAAELDGNVRLGSAILQGCGYGNNLLNKRNPRCLARVSPPEPVIIG